MAGPPLTVEVDEVGIFLADALLEGAGGGSFDEDGVVLAAWESIFVEEELSLSGLPGSETGEVICAGFFLKGLSPGIIDDGVYVRKEGVDYASAYVVGSVILC